jgi:hypothetical protein
VNYDACAQRLHRSFALNPQDFDMTACGVPIPPKNQPYVDLYKAYAYSNVLGVAGSGTDILLDEKKTVDCDSDFFMWKITLLTTAYLVRFQWPNGRFSSQVMQDARTFFGTVVTKDCDGSIRPIRIPAGRDIGIGIQNLSGIATANVTMLFEGVSRFYLCR